MRLLIFILCFVFFTYNSAFGQGKYEYVISTKSIEGAPLIIKQIDAKNHNDQVPNHLVVGSYRPSKYTVTPVEGYEYLQFSPWSGYCVPILFEVDSEENYINKARIGKSQDGIYYLAALCRGKQFYIQYFKHQNSVWHEINPNEFPKERALENLWDWIGGGIKYTMDTPKYIQDGLRESDKPFVREKTVIKPDAYVFFTGLTARMWAHLESGIDFWQFDNKFTDDEAKMHVKNYIEKYSIK